MNSVDIQRQDEEMVVIGVDEVDDLEMPVMVEKEATEHVSDEDEDHQVTTPRLEVVSEAKTATFGSNTRSTSKQTPSTLLQHHTMSAEEPPMT